MPLAPEQPPFQVLTKKVPVVVVTQEIDFANAPDFAAALAEATDAAKGGAIIADLSDCAFMDSSGLHVLLKAQRSASRIPIVAPPSGPVARLLDLAARDLVETYPDRSAAETALKSSRAA